MAGLRRDTFRDDLDDCGPIPLDALIWIKNRIDPTLTFVVRAAKAYAGHAS